MDREFYCREVAGETGAGTSGFSGSDTGEEAGTGETVGETDPTASDGEAGYSIEAAELDDKVSVLEGAGLSTFLKYLWTDRIIFSSRISL